MFENVYRVPAPRPPEPPPPPDPYELAWASLRWRRAVMLVAFALSAVSARTLPGDLGLLVAFAIGTVAMLASAMVSYFDCPRCGELFGKKHWLINTGWTLFVRRCVHCGLEMGSARGERPATEE